MAIEVKICGVNTPLAFDTAAGAGADWVGFVFVAASPRAVTPGEAARIAAARPGGPGRVGLFVEPTDEDLGRALDATHLDAVQLYASAGRAYDVRRRFGVPVWLAIGVAEPADLPSEAPPGVDRLLLDAKPKAGAALPGGNAHPFDWTMLRGWRAPLPWMLRTVWNDHARYEAYWRQVPGCYTAGDVAVIDEDGYVAVLGRADDVLNVAGHRIGTADVEGSLLRHPAVAESAVIGLPDPIKGERIKAYVVVKPGQAAGPGLVASLKDHVRLDLGPIAQPSEVEVRASLPKTRSGKIVRRMLKAEAMGVDPGDLSTLAD